MSRHFFAAVASCALVLAPLSAAEAERDYVRYVGDDKRGKLETVVVSMRKGDIKLDLVGAVHIGDKAYYSALTELFKGYDALLFELVDGQRVKEELEGKKDQLADKDTDPAFKFIRGMMTSLSSYFKFQYQTEGIDYRTDNFVHADVSLDEFQQMQDEKGESFFTLFQKAMRAQMEVGVDKSAEPKGSQLLLALLGDSSGLKVAMARSLSSADKLLDAVDGGDGTVILSGRNQVALRVFEKEVAAGKKNLGIFYGAAHLPDMENRLQKMGYERTGEKWVTAWDIQPAVQAGAKPSP
jgi:hypothetical protein